MNDEILKKNIKYLLLSRGMTLDDLANKLHKSGANSISNWFKRGFPEEELEDIANIFEVSVDMLKNIELDTDVVKIYNNDESLFFNQLKLLFPFQVSNKALKNNKFFKAYDIHKKFYEFEYIEDAFDKAHECYNLYFEAYNSGILEGLLNMLSISCLYKFLSKHFSFEMDFTENEISNIPEFESLSEFSDMNENIKRKLLRMFTIYNDSEKKNKIDRFISTTSNEILNLLFKIKIIPKYKDFVDYYLSIMYLNNLLDTGYTKSQNALFGQMYIDLLVSLNNPYAKKLNDFFDVTNCE